MKDLTQVSIHAPGVRRWKNEYRTTIITPQAWFYSVAVSTSDSDTGDSGNPGSIPGRTSAFAGAEVVEAATIFFWHQSWSESSGTSECEVTA